VNHTVVEPAFIEKLELHGDLAWQIGIAAAAMIGAMSR
jgi:hypothetical protein